MKWQQKWRALVDFTMYREVKGSEEGGNYEGIKKMI